MKALRIFIYVQHLSGVGHTVRMQRLGQVLAGRHQVTILDGGRELPFPAVVQRLCVPRLTRIDGALASVETSTSLKDTLAQRTALLSAHLEAEAPDIILVEHYPFSKWQLEPEILHLLARARQANPAVQVVSSLRDISPATRYEQTDDYPSRVLNILHDHFDALLVHGDPGLCTLQDSFPSSELIQLPVYHTGLVTAPAVTLSEDKRRQMGIAERYVVASVGGGSDRAGLAARVEQAWQTLQAQGALTDMCLIVFGGLDQPGQRKGNRPASPGAISTESIVHMRFAEDFREWLGSAALSISCAGYNTCADLLAAGTRALLIANTAMSDQMARARLLEQRGIAALIPEAKNGADPLGPMILQALDQAPAVHSLDLKGAETSLHILEELQNG